MRVMIGVEEENHLRILSCPILLVFVNGCNWKLVFMTLSYSRASGMICFY